MEKEECLDTALYPALHVLKVIQTQTVMQCCNMVAEPVEGATASRGDEG